MGVLWLLLWLDTQLVRYKGAVSSGACIITAPLPTTAPCSDGQPDHRGGFVVATRLRTPVAITSYAGQSMKAYRITTPFWAEFFIFYFFLEEGGGVAVAIQLHREVRPESGLVGIVNT